jgi:hypothetical protein
MFIAFPHRPGLAELVTLPGCFRAVRAISPGLDLPVALQILLQLAMEDIGQLTDLQPCVAGDRFTVIRRRAGG